MRNVIYLAIVMQRLKSEIRLSCAAVQLMAFSHEPRLLLNLLTAPKQSPLIDENQLHKIIYRLNPL